VDLTKAVSAAPAGRDRDQGYRSGAEAPLFALLGPVGGASQQKTIIYPRRGAVEAALPALIYAASI
jgi:hypothetical protein